MYSPYGQRPLPLLERIRRTPTPWAVGAGLFALVVFGLAVFGSLQTGKAKPRISSYNNPPGVSYHVNSVGQVVQGGGVGLSPLTPVPQHANLLDQPYHITSEFGHYPSGGAHHGLDLDAWTGTVMHAPVNGTVTGVLRGCVEGDKGCGKGWGNHVWFKSAETGNYVLLAHFSEINSWVEVGATFDAGAPFGKVGSTGYSSGPHVHLQVNSKGMDNEGSTNPAWEFPWLRCGEPVLGARFGATCP